MFSKELQELDRNTVSYMIDEMQEEINQQKAELQKKDIALQGIIEEHKADLQARDAEIRALKQQLAALKN